MWFQASSDTHINHNHPCSHLPGEHVYGSATTQEVIHHLRGDFLRDGTHSFGDDAMITGHGKDDLAPNLGQRLGGDARQLQR